MAEKSFTLDLLSGPDRAAVTGMKKSVTDLAFKLGIVRQRAADLAPKVIKLFKSLDAKYSNLGGFVGFARLFDPKMPTHGADTDDEPGYRSNRTYQALDYMRRIVNLGQRTKGQQGKRDPATDQLARLLATVLSVKGIDDAAVWSAVSQEFKLRDRGLARLQSRVEKCEPVIDLSAAAIKGPAKIIHMEPATKPAPGTVMETLETAAKAVGAKRNRRVHVAA